MESQLETVSKQNRELFNQNRSILEQNLELLEQNRSNSKQNMELLHQNKQLRGPCRQPSNQSYYPGTPQNSSTPNTQNASTPVPWDDQPSMPFAPAAVTSPSPVVHYAGAPNDSFNFQRFPSTPRQRPRPVLKAAVTSPSLVVHYAGGHDDSFNFQQPRFPSASTPRQRPRPVPEAAFTSPTTVLEPIEAVVNDYKFIPP